MDKKTTGIISAMLAACMLIVSWALVSPRIGTSGSANASYASAYTERFFDRDKVIDIYVTIAQADYDDMLQNPKEEEYKQVDIVIDGEKVSNVGFRTKGNSSLNMVASSDSDRFSFKVDFDQYNDGQSLLGLTKLNLNNCIQDPSYMREYLSYSLLEQMGVPVPAYCYANIYINGEAAGLYLAVEGIEDSFVKRYYGNNYGTLYKPYGERGAGTDLVYKDDNIESYSGLQAVTKAKNGSSEALVEMLKALSEGRDLDKYLDIDEILKYFAVNTVLVNMDSYQGQFTHNYYLYEENGVFSFLPWDYNLSFGGFSMGGSQGSTSLYIDQPLSGTTMDARPLVSKLLEVPEYKELYHKYINEFIDGPFSFENMSAEIEKVADMIRPYVEKDPTKFYTMEQFEQAISESTSGQNSFDGTVEAGDAPQADAAEGGTQAAGGQAPAGRIGGQQGAVGGNANQLPDMQNFNGQNFNGRNQGGMGMQQGGNMMMGGSSTGLLTFIRERISNVSKQLSGELPSYGSSEQTQGNGQLPQWNNQNAQGNGQMPQGGNQDTQGNGQLPQGGNQNAQDNGQIPQGNNQNIPGNGQLPQRDFRNRQGDGQAAQDAGGQRTPNADMQNPQGKNGAPGGFQGDMNMAGGMGELSGTDISQNLYTIAGAVVLMLGALVMVFKKRNKYSL